MLGQTNSLVAFGPVHGTMDGGGGGAQFYKCVSTVHRNKKQNKSLTIYNSSGHGNQK